MRRFAGVNPRVDVRSAVFRRRIIVGGIEVTLFSFAFKNLLTRELFCRHPIENYLIDL